MGTSEKRGGRRSTFVLFCNSLYKKNAQNNEIIAMFYF